MAEFELYSCEELNNFLKLLINQRSNKLPTNEDFDFPNTDFFYSKHYMNAGKIHINFSLSSFQKIYKNLENSSCIDTCLYSDNFTCLEIPIQFLKQCEIKKICQSNQIFTIEDPINNILYTISYSSQEYGLLCLNHIKSAAIKKQQLNFNLRWDDFAQYNIKQKEINTNDLFKGFLNIFTIKIKSQDLLKLFDKEKKIFYLKKLLESFNFQILLKYKTIYNYYSSTNNLLNINQNQINEYKVEDYRSPPQRIYREHLIDYYRLAISSNAPFAQYLSYYHVLEYFFDEVFDKKIFDDFKENIQNNSDFITNENKQKEIIKKLKKDIRNNNELKCLELVLRKFVKIIELQDKLKSEQIKYFQQHKITFSDAPTISFKDKRGFYIQLAQRIYQTRNALVHSKENHVGRYKPYQDSEELNKEIPLIKLIAELVIINSSDPL